MDNINEFIYKIVCKKLETVFDFEFEGVKSYVIENFINYFLPFYVKSFYKQYTFKSFFNFLEEKFFLIEDFYFREIFVKHIEALKKDIKYYKEIYNHNIKNISVLGDFHENLSTKYLIEFINLDKKVLYKNNFLSDKKTRDIFVYMDKDFDFLIPKIYYKKNQFIREYIDNKGNKKNSLDIKCKNY